MALPVIDPLDLERFPIVLNGAPLPLVGDVTGTATAANPAGLRLSGGNTFRDYTPWAEQEFTDWAMGMGYENMSDGGYLYSDLYAGSGDGFGLASATVGPQTIGSLTAPSGRTWSSDWQIETKIIEASNGKLYAFWGYYIFECNPTSGTWAQWLDIRGTIFTSAGSNEEAAYIIDMCEFAGWLVVVTKPYFYASEPSVVGPDVKEDAPLDNQFKIMTGAGGSDLVYYHPNVYFVNLASKVVFGMRANSSLFPLGNPAAHLNSAAATDGICGTICATACFTFSGYLFIGGSAGFAYTNGESNSGTSSKPHIWAWDGAFSGALHRTPPVGGIVYHRLSTLLDLSTEYGGSNWVTGFAGIQGQTMGDFYVYMATSRGLYLLDLAVPIAVKVMEFDGTDVRNGRGMTAHNNDIYIPYNNGDSVWRYTQSGQVLNVGLDQSPVGPEIYRAGYSGNAAGANVSQLASTPNMLIASTNLGGLETSATTRPPIFGLKSQGWHVLHGQGTAMGTAAVPGGVRYVGSNRTIHWISAEIRSASPTSVKFNRFEFNDNRRESTTRQDTGTMFLGWFDAGSPLLQKDWHSISLYGTCLDHPNFTVEVFYSVTNEIRTNDCLTAVSLPSFNPADYLGLAELYTFDNDAAEYVLPTLSDGCYDISKPRSGIFLGISVRITRTGGSAGSITPTIKGIKVKYFTPIADYFRFSYSVVLPSECLNDLCDVPLVGYVQDDWDQAIREAACAVEPVKFRDIDGKWYLVRVESESRRVAKVKYVGPPTYREHEISWSLVLTQLMNPSICEDGWEPACPP